MFQIAFRSDKSWSKLAYLLAFLLFGCLVIPAHAQGTGPRNPRGRLVEVSGYFYGTTRNGGTNGNGTVFKMDSSGNVTIVYSFGTLDGSGHNTSGAHPYAGLLVARDGSFYGTTRDGGANGTGTIYRINQGTFSVIHAFSALNGSGDNSEGAYPYGSLTQDRTANNLFYGTASAGGSNGTGTVYKLDHTSNTVVSLHSFTALNAQALNQDGADPRSELFQTSDNTLYGTAYQGGPYPGPGTSPQGRFSSSLAMARASRCSMHFRGLVLMANCLTEA